jgi:uncharacterized integral membrane protein (TIGR00698 family)
MADLADSDRAYIAYSFVDDPGVLQSLGSLEGVPDVPVELIRRARWQQNLHDALNWAGEMSPGLVLAASLAWIGSIVATGLGESLLGFERSPISPILITILLGLAIRNVAGLPGIYEQGLRLSVKRILRIGIALLGLRLSLGVVAETSIIALPVIVGCIAAALVLVSWLSRFLVLPRRLGTLIAVGTSICGVSAIVATAPIIEADEEETSYAVACITLFGMLSLFISPFLAHWIFNGDPMLAGIFLGTAVHDTAQAAGAGMMYEQNFNSSEAFNIAATTKLVRNVCMGAVIPLMAILYHRNNADAASGNSRLKWRQYVPFFVIGFILFSALATLGDLGTESGGKAFSILDRDLWDSVKSSAQSVSFACLSIAMAAVGLGTSITRLKILGLKPLCTGLSVSLLVGGVSIGLIKVLSMFFAVG